MKRRLFKTLVAVLAIAAAAAGPAWGQTTYNVTFGGFNNPVMNTTVSVTSLPQTFTQIGGLNFYPFTVLSDGGEFISASVTSGGDGKVSANIPSLTQMTITVSGTFEGTATIHVVGSDNQEHPVSCDITVACAVPPVPITVRMAAGTEEAANWSISSGNASVPGTQVLENVMSGSELTATYSGTRKVKSVKAVKYVPPAATVTTAPTATAAIIEAGSTTALVNAGAANGGTMMYAVTTTNAQPASTADFSATRPTAEGRAAGTYYVWFYAKADADHSDSEIAGPVSVTLAVMTTVTWNSTNVFNSGHEDDDINQWHPDPLTYESITISFNGDGDDFSLFRAYDIQAQTGMLMCYGDEGESFTFTAPSGKKFCKIEIINNESISFEDYGDWTSDETGKKFVWSGTAASSVTLGTVSNFADRLISIVFKLIDD